MVGATVLCRGIYLSGKRETLYDPYAFVAIISKQTVQGPHKRLRIRFILVFLGGVKESKFG